jgi:hypothetical protein
MDEKYEGSLKNYRQWMKFIRDADPKLPPKHDKDTLKLYCLIKSMEGFNGLGCYAGDDVLAKQLKWNRDTVRKYKRLALELGWFGKTGKRKGRAEVLDIAIPDGDTYRPTSGETVISPERSLRRESSRSADNETATSEVSDLVTSGGCGSCYYCKEDEPQYCMNQKSEIPEVDPWAS